MKLLIPLFIFTLCIQTFNIQAQEDEKLKDREATFPGGTEAMFKFLSENIEFPEIAMELGDQGKVFLEFVVNKDGSIEQVAILKGVSKAIDKEAIRVINAMPNWIPAVWKGEIVRARCRIPINFILESDEDIVESPKKPAFYMGGKRKLNRYLRKKSDKKIALSNSGEAGSFDVDFVVNRDGSTEQIEISKDISYTEIVRIKRLIRNMKKWKPAVHQRKRVRSRVKIIIKIK